MSWSSIRANLKRFVNLNGVLIIVLVISNVFFDIPDNAEIKKGTLTQSEQWNYSEKSITVDFPNKSNKKEVIKFTSKYNIPIENNYCLSIISNGTNLKFPSIPLLLCKLSNDIGNIAIHILYFEIIPIQTKEKENANKILFNVFHLNRAFPQKLEQSEKLHLDKPLQYSTLSLRFYHFLLFLLTIGLVRWINIKSPFFSHKRNIQQIDDLLDSLTGKISRTKSRELSKPAQWVQSIFIDSESHTYEQEKSDPRTIELAFLSILNEIRHTSNIFPLTWSKNLYSQAIEVTFVFDELDKLTAHSDGEIQVYKPVSKKSTSQQNETNEYQTEQSRNDKMLHLLSDMKRILSAAPARFIFVGGRPLYDQWLADSTKKQPLLTSIFNGQINLKSLLVHHDNHWDEEIDKCDNNRELSDTTTFHSRIEEYLYLQHYYSKQRHVEWVSKQWVPFFGLHNEPQIESDFSQWTFNISEKEFYKKIKFISCEEASGNEKISNHLSKFYLESFISFLTYRSAGNPKKLKELLASFVQPTSRIINNRKLREQHFSDQDVLTISSLQTLRIELISSIYEHLRTGFEKEIVSRDDKIVEALFYLTDFLFKFHSRAFSWDSLERIDELDHVHRPPDLHIILEKLVDHSSEKFLHKVFNGMYSFRFRSDLTKEIAFLSRYSSEEMAAFNFTLDESQALKQSYKRALGTADNLNPDLVSGLGALYEYDQDFEAARHNYRHAIKILDDKLADVVGSEVDITTKGDEHQKIRLLKAIYSNELSGQKNSTFDLSWGATRLRIMLKIGLSFERTNNYERAILQYRQCLTLSNILIDAYIKKLPSKSNIGITNYFSSDDSICEYSQVLKQLSIIFQSIFASAWATEKWVGGIDAGVSITEKELRSLRKRLPFVRNQNITKNKSTAEKILEIGNAYFSVIMSQLHNKAGDLYFFKGIQNIEYQFLGDPHNPEINNTGYLLNAHKHYAISLHELRRYIFYRTCRLENTDLHFKEQGEKLHSIAEGCWPNYQTLAVSEGLSDLSESTLALVSGWQLIESVFISTDRNIPARIFHNRFKQNILKQIFKWFEMSDDDTDMKIHISVRVLSQRKKLLLKDWFGVWGSHSTHGSILKSTGDIIDFPKLNPIQDRFLMSLYLSIASADLRENAGYLENAAHEYLQVCDTISQYLWWVCSKNQLVNNGLGEKIEGKQFFIHCLSIGVWVLEYIDELYRLVRKTQNAEKYKIGRTIPPSALTLACSLGIVTKLIFPPITNQPEQKNLNLLLDRLNKLIIVWRGEKEYTVENFQSILDMFDSEKTFNTNNERKKRNEELDELCDLSNGLLNKLLSKQLQNNSLENLILTMQNLIKGEKIEKEFNKSWVDFTELIANLKGQDQYTETDFQSILKLININDKATSIFNKLYERFNELLKNNNTTTSSQQYRVINFQPILRRIIENKESRKELCSILADFNELTAKWYKEIPTYFQSILKSSICIHKYPVLNQLNTLKVLIDSAVFSSEKLDSNCVALIEELHELNSRYNAPLHFTPNMLGITYASFWIKSKESNQAIRPLNFDLESEVLRAFRVSREMYTMGRGYYTAIDNLYYLYDDFNDRLIHRNHAMQIASAEIVRQYEKFIRKNMK